MRDEKTSHIPEEWLVPTVSPDEALADSLGSYRLCFEVASGGMATVYLALYEGALGFEKVVALKKIHKHLARERQFVDMFFDEARIAAHIDHPFVCKVVDFGNAQDTYYIAMEYLVGEPLSEVYEAFQQHPELAASTELPRVVARVIADLAEGLHAAHELTDDGDPLNLVHRDVTPANLFVLYDGTVRVVDFGIAKVKNRISHTETGHVKGKYAYVSPEQLKMKPLDRRCDVWALGVVMWEMLTARRLFKRENPVDTIGAVTADEIPKPSSIRPDVPPALDKIVMRALSRRVAGRHHTARDLAVELDGWLATTGHAVPRAEVADWLQALFPGAASRKRKLMELTRRGESAIPIADRPVDAPANPMAVTAQTTVFRADAAVRKTPAGDGARRSRARLRAVQEPTQEVGEDEIEILRDLRKDTNEDEVTEDRAVARDETTSEDRSDRPALRIDEDERRRRAPPETRAGSRAGVVLGAVAVVALALAGLIHSGMLFGGEEPDPVPEVPVVSERPRERVREEPPSEREPGTDDERSTDDLASLGQQAEPEVWPPWAASGEGGEAAEGQTGEVSLTTRGGWADVYIQGRKVGRTPQELRLPVGRHRIVLRPNGGTEERPMNVEVRAGRRVYLDVAVPE
jgi:serine/threonine-protein kinase